MENRWTIARWRRYPDGTIRREFERPDPEAERFRAYEPPQPKESPDLATLAEGYPTLVAVAELPVPKDAWRRPATCGPRSVATCSTKPLARDVRSSEAAVQGDPAARE